VPAAARDVQPPLAIMPVVAVFSADEDTVLLRPHLRDVGYEPVGAYVREIRDGTVDVLAFLRAHRPDAVVYEVEPPLKANWNFVRLIRNAAGVRNPRFILLTSDKPGLERTIGRGAVNELVFAKPYDLAEILRVVRFVVDDRTVR
jgi:DNA-binding response OmpR family regulator